MTATAEVSVSELSAIRRELSALIDLLAAGGVIRRDEPEDGDARRAFDRDLGDTIEHVPRELSGERLTVRERKVIAGLFAGKTDKEIGTDLHLAPVSVRAHVHNLYAKTWAQNRAQLIAVVLLESLRPVGRALVLGDADAARELVDDLLARLEALTRRVY